MKTIIALMLLIVAFSVVALAFEHPVMDLVVARDECGTLFSGCSSNADCCEKLCLQTVVQVQNWGKIEEVFITDGMNC
uniref:U20-Sparatoxin-Hju1v_1 n=1 Tax=Heteropoda jugulans TaxID=1358901 RepID=A0A4Q8KDB8_9ARAC